MKKLILMTIYISFFASMSYAQPGGPAQSIITQNATLTTYYPSQFGVYDKIRLSPYSRDAADCNVSGEVGLIYYDETGNEIMLCKDTTGLEDYAWVPIGVGGGLWNLVDVGGIEWAFLSNDEQTVGIGFDDPSSDPPSTKSILHARDGAVLFDGDVGETPTSGPGKRFMWIPEKAALRVGEVTGNQWDDINIGDNSMAFGLNATASGEGSIALGTAAFAGSVFVAPAGSGLNSIAIGNASHAEGDYSIALGHNAKAYAKYSTSIRGTTGVQGGDQTVGEGSVAIGGGTATGDSSTIISSGGVARGFASTVIGSFASEASGDHSIAIGHTSLAEGFASVAIGDHVTAEADHSMVIGKGNEGSGNFTNDVSNSLIIGFKDSMAAPAIFVQDGHVGINRMPAPGNTLVNALEVGGNAGKATTDFWSNASDRRIKTDIRDLENSLEVIDELRPVKFRYTEEYMTEHPSIKDHYYYNFIAQEYREVFPEDVKTGSEGYLQMSTNSTLPHLVAAVQELNDVFKELEEEKEEIKQIKENLQAER